MQPGTVIAHPIAVIHLYLNGHIFKNMIKYFFTTILLALSTVAAIAQSNDPAAKAILDAVSAKFKTFKTVQANFSYKVESAAGKTLSTKTGTLLIKGIKYRVSFAGQEIFCNGTTIWNYDKSANEVTISKADASGSAITPQKLFSNFYDNDFLYMLNGEKKVAGKTLQEIEMTPKDKSKPYHKVYLLIDKAAKTIYSTKVLQTDNNRISYTITTMKTNANLADPQFVFDKTKYPGVEETDLR